MALGFIFTLMTSGAVWMIGSDRIQAVAAYDGAFPGFFGVFNKRLGTPVRVNVLSGLVASGFTVAAIQLLRHQSTADAFTVVLTIAISTTLISYLWIFPAGAVLRRKFPDVHRPYRVPFGDAGIWVSAILITLWVALGTLGLDLPGPDREVDRHHVRLQRHVGRLVPQVRGADARNAGRRPADRSRRLHARCAGSATHGGYPARGRRDACARRGRAVTAPP